MIVQPRDLTLFSTGKHTFTRANQMSEAGEAPFSEMTSGATGLILISTALRRIAGAHSNLVCRPHRILANL